MDKTVTLQEKYKSILLSTFKYVIDFLEAHNLKWFVCAGTLLGAIRHQGMIPWDDDIDICMPKDDYDKLIAIKEELIKDNYKLLSLSNPGYYCTSCKIVNTNTTLWERERYPFIIGVFIDIFPIYQTDLPQQNLIERINKCDSLFVSYLRTIKRIPFHEFLQSLFVDHSRVWREYIINKLSFSRKRTFYLEQFNKYEQQLHMGKGENSVFYYAFGGGEKLIRKTSWYDDYIMKPFEDFSVRVPVGYHHDLTLSYGDYMTPPPEKERVETHKDLRYYINLNEGLTLAEVKRRIKRGEREVY